MTIDVDLGRKATKPTNQPSLQDMQRTGTIENNTGLKDKIKGF